jgi:hypothetical protein
MHEHRIILQAMEDKEKKALESRIQARGGFVLEGLSRHSREKKGPKPKKRRCPGK